MTLADPYHWILDAARTTPDALCLEDDSGRRLSYGETHALVGRHAAALGALGVRVGDRVALQVEKSLDAVVVYLACLHSGAVILPLNTAYTTAELEYFLTDSQPTLLLCRPGSEGAALGAVHQAGDCRIETLGAEEDGTYLDVVAAQRVSPDPVSVTNTALAALLYTSGTTGRSKGAMITRGNLVSNAAALATTWHMSAQDRLVHVLPLFHVHGLFLSLNALFAVGASVRLHRRFDPSETLQSLATGSVFMGVPTHYTRLLASPVLNPDAVRGVRLFISGSAPLLAETHREFEARTGKAILERYGMTETLVNTSNPYDGVRKPGSVGLPLPGVEVRITDTNPATEGAEIGMIEIRGPNVCAGYWRSPEKTLADRTPDGFFRTGDLGHIDPDGYLHISGRAKDLIISGGYNVYPKEVELELDALPSVGESAVFGVPHPDFGEGVTAVVTLEPGMTFDESDAISTLKQTLASYKIPKRIFIVKELPRNTMGKVQKVSLKATYATIYGHR